MTNSGNDCQCISRRVALSGGLRSVLSHGGGLPVRDLLVLCAWAAVAIAVAARAFRWE